MEKTWTDFILNALPFFLLVIFWFWMMWRMKKGGGNKWQENMERQIQQQETLIQTLKETNELLRKNLANR